MVPVVVSGLPHAKDLMIDLPGADCPVLSLGTDTSQHVELRKSL